MDSRIGLFLRKRKEGWTVSYLVEGSQVKPKKGSFTTYQRPSIRVLLEMLLKP